MKAFKRKKGKLVSDKHLGMGQSLQLSLCADSVTPCDLSLDGISFRQFAGKITEGEAGERIQSSDNYFFF